MDNNQISETATIYRDVIVRNSIISSDALLADDSLVINSTVGRNSVIERRCMLFNSIINDHNTIGFNSVVRNAEIGKYCSIAWNVSIGGAEHSMNHLTTSFFPFEKRYGIIDDNTPFGEESDPYKKPVIIGNDVWIAAGAHILRGVKIGDGAIIAAGAVVTQDVPAYEVWGGVKSRCLKKRFSEEIIQELIGIKWWNLPEDILKKYVHYFRVDVTLQTLTEFKENLKQEGVI